MLAFYREYADSLTVVQEPLARMPAPEKVPQPVAQIRSTQEVPQPAALLPDALLWSVPWAHHVILIDTAIATNLKELGYGG